MSGARVVRVPDPVVRRAERRAHAERRERERRGRRAARRLKRALWWRPELA